EGPAWRADLVVVALRRAVHAELRRAVAEMVARPIAEPAFHGLKDAAPGGSAFLPGSRQRALGGEWFVLLVRVVRLDPGTGQPDLEIGQRIVNERPDCGVEPHAGTVAAFGWKLLVPEPDIPVQAL